MRLDSVREILKDNVNRLVIDTEPTEGGKNYKLRRFMIAIGAVREIQDTGMFQVLCRSILAQEVIVLAVHEPIVVSAGIASDFEAKLNSLRTRAQYVLDALNEFVTPLPEECIRVRLPETNDLETAAKITLDLNKLLNQVVVNEYVSGEVSLKGFTQGSLWIDICLGSLSAYHLIAALVRLYFEARQRQAQQAARSQFLQDLTLSVDIRKAVAKAINDEVDAYRKHRLKELLEEAGVPPSDHEFALRVENSLKMLGDLLERGLEIHPSLMASIEERKRLPDPKLILEAIKALPSGNVESEET